MRVSRGEKPPSWDCGYRVRVVDGKWICEYVDPWGKARRLSHPLERSEDAERVGKDQVGRVARERSRR